MPGHKQPTQWARIHIRLPDHVMQAVALAANAQRRSISGQIAVMLERYMAAVK